MTALRIIAGVGLGAVTWMVVLRGGFALVMLAWPEYTAADPRLVTFNEVGAQGVTPLAVKFGQTYNDPQGPWLVLTRNAVFNPDEDTVADDNAAVTESLQ